MTACRSCSSYEATRSDLLCDGCGAAVDGGARLAGAYGVAFDPLEAGRMLLRALGDRIDGAALPPEVGEAAREMLGWLDENPEADPDGRGRGLAETALRELDALSEETTR